MGLQSLIALDGAGYTDIVGVRMGYNGWINKFTNKLQRRRSDGYRAPYLPHTPSTSSSAASPVCIRLQARPAL